MPAIDEIRTRPDEVKINAPHATKALHPYNMDKGKNNANNGVGLLVLIISNLIAIVFSVLSCVWLSSHGVIGHEFVSLDRFLAPNLWFWVLALVGAAILIIGAHLLFDSPTKDKTQLRYSNHEKAPDMR